MLVEALRTLFAYSDWANERVLDAADGLTPEQWLQPGTAGHGSVRDTLVHVLSAQRNWLGFCDGSLSDTQAFGQELDPADYPDPAAVRDLARRIGAASRDYVGALDAAGAAASLGGTFPWSGESFSRPVWLILLHVANHGTQHRSEAAAMLTDFGRSPGFLDLMGYTLDLMGYTLE